MSPRSALPLLLAAIVALAGGCSKRKHGFGGRGGGIVKVDGSSTVFPISQAVAEEFQRAGEGDVTVAASGTGGGFKKFCRGEIAVAGASRPIRPSEVEACAAAGIEYIELPVAYDGLAIAVHPKNDWVDHLTVAELKAMWAPEAQEKVTSWAHVRDGFPARRLRLFGPGTDSGTYDYFTQAIVGKEHSSRGDFTSNEDDNVLVQGVSMDENALGFFGFAYYIENKDKLKAIPIDDGDPSNGDGPVYPTLETVANGTYQPLSRPIFIYVSTKALEREAVEAFVYYFLDHAPELAAAVGYIPLPERAYALARGRFEARTTGSVFAGKGSQVGVTVEQLLADSGGR